LFCVVVIRIFRVNGHRSADGPKRLAGKTYRRAGKMPFRYLRSAV
jgi:hypothetical protein